MWRRTKHRIRRREAALRLLSDLSPGRLLDSPCGEGALSHALRERGHEVWASDLDPKVFAKERGGIRFDVVDLNQSLPYPDVFFDAVVSLEGIEHLEMPAFCLQEFARILRPGGRLVLSTPNVNKIQSRLFYFLGGQFGGFKTLSRKALEPPPGPVPWHITVPYLPTIAFLLNRSGFLLDRVEITMIKTKDWLLLPLALPMWLRGMNAKAGTVERMLGTWRLLLGRSVILRATKRGGGFNE